MKEPAGPPARPSDMSSMRAVIFPRTPADSTVVSTWPTWACVSSRMSAAAQERQSALFERFKFILNDEG